MASKAIREPRMVEVARVNVSELDLAGLALAHLRMHIAAGTPSDVRLARILAKELEQHAKSIRKEISQKWKNGKTKTKTKNTP